MYTWWNTALLSCYLKLSITTDFFLFKTRSYYQYYLFNNGFLRKTLFSDLIQENKTSPILFESCEDMAHFLSFEEKFLIPSKQFKDNLRKTKLKTKNCRYRKSTSSGWKQERQLQLTYMGEDC